MGQAAPTALSDVDPEAVETARNESKNPIELGFSKWRACEVIYPRKAHWRCAKHAGVQTAVSNKRLAHAGYYSLSDRHESLHLYG